MVRNLTYDMALGRSRMWGSVGRYRGPDSLMTTVDNNTELIRELDHALVG